MRAIDTNVLARFLLGDDPGQYLIARRILEDDVLLPVTVLVELGWLLESRYKLSRATIHDLMLKIVQLPSVHLADEPSVLWAIARFGEGADFADMVHLVVARDAASFATFDKGIAKGAGEHSPIPVETLKAP